MEAGHFRNRKPLNSVCMRDLIKLHDPLYGHGRGGGPLIPYTQEEALLIVKTNCCP
jgi:hypothetical protein